MIKHGRPVFVSTGCVRGVEPLPARLCLLREFGLRNIELGSGVSAEPAEIAALTQDGCSYLVHNYFPPPRDPFVLNLASGNTNVRRRSVSHVLAALKLALRLKAPFYSVHAGFVTDPCGFDGTSFVFPAPDSPMETAAAMERFGTALSEILQHAERLGLQLLVENNVFTPGLRDNLLLAAAEDFLGLLRRLSSPNLGMLLDLGHLGVTARTFGFSATSYASAVAPYVRAMHVHDNDGTADTHQPIQAGSWVLDVLRRPEFVGLPVIVEARFGSVFDLRQHVGWLKTEMGRE